MATIMATQDIVDGDYSEEEQYQAKDVWGRLFSLRASFVAMDLTADTYTFGRGEDCDVPFNSHTAKNQQFFQAYSKIHFKIHRTETNKGVDIILEDTSSNGTFINGEKVGKGKKRVLHNNDEIAIAMIKNKAYVFVNTLDNQNANLPAELTDKYTLTSLLGKGACGEVKLAYAKYSMDKFACKIISKKKFTMGGKAQINLATQVMGEVKILKALKHPCIIGIEDVIDTPDMLYIVLELVEGGELFDKVVSIDRYDEAVGKLLFFQMATAVKYLHDEGITHRDLKPENILLASDELETLIKVTDFGLSKFVNASSILKTFCGTPTYLAPEILKSAGSGSYTKAIDCWSLGVILFIMLSGYPPFSDERKDMDLPSQIMGGHYTFPKQYWGDVSATAIDLIQKMLMVDPSKRLTFDEVLEHPWLQDEEMRAKAHLLMYPNSEGMAPPKGAAAKRKAAGDGEEPASKRH